MNNDTDKDNQKNNNVFQMINLVHVTSVNRELTKVVRKWDRVGVGEEEKSEYDLRREEYFRKMYTDQGCVIHFFSSAPYGFFPRVWLFSVFFAILPL